MSYQKSKRLVLKLTDVGSGTASKERRISVAQAFYPEKY